MDIFTIINNGQLPKKYINRFRENNINSFSYSDARIKEIIIDQLINCTAGITFILDKQIKEVNENTNGGYSEIVEEILYSSLSTFIGLYNNELGNRLELLTGNAEDHLLFHTKLKDDLTSLLEDFLIFAQEYDNAIDVDRNLHEEENPTKLIAEYEETLYKLNHNPRFLIQAPLKVREKMKLFIIDSIRILKIREKSLKNEIPTEVKTESKLKMETIALIHYYLSEHSKAEDISTDKQDEIAKKFGYESPTSGKKIRAYYYKLKSSKTERVGLKNNKKSDSAKKKRFEDCLEYLKKNTKTQSLKIAKEEYSDFLDSYHSNY